MTSGDATATERRRTELHLCLSVAEKQLVYPLAARGEVVVGRDLEVELSIDDRSLSRRHALVRRDDAGITIEDLASKNGIYFHGRLLVPGRKQRLVLGDSVLLGEILLGVVGKGTSPGADDVWAADVFAARVRYERQHGERRGRAGSTLQIRPSGAASLPRLRQLLGAERPLAALGEGAYVALVFAHESAERLAEQVRAAGASVSLRSLADDEVDKRRRVAVALEACGGNQSRAAQVLGISRPTLIRWVAQLGLPRPQEARAAAVSDDPETSAAHAALRQALEDALARCAGNQVHAAELLQISRYALIRRMRRYGLR